MLLRIDNINLNGLMVSSLRRAIEQAKHAHHTDIEMRLGGKDVRFEADWIKHIVVIEDTETVVPLRKP
jgi:hypothetical protein